MCSISAAHRKLGKRGYTVTGCLHDLLVGTVSSNLDEKGRHQKMITNHTLFVLDFTLCSGKSLKSESAALHRALLCLAVPKFPCYAESGHARSACACVFCYTTKLYFRDETSKNSS